MKLFMPLVRLAEGWAENVSMQIDAHGIITAIERGSHARDAEVLNGPVVPGMPNTHSHAFQRLMAGLTEWRAGQYDSFWSWRDVMYRYAAQIDPEIMQAVATHLYIEMLQAGYTSVCEFHYLHHDQNGGHYEPVGRMSEALINAAQDVGIRMTLLPTWYLHGDFGKAPANATQKRFCNSYSQLKQLISELKSLESATLRVGGACHSLRAVPPQQVAGLSEFLSSFDTPSPFHIHIAEQQLEVQDSMAHLGQRPVDFLLDHVPMHSQVCLVHATHVTEEECERLAQSAACVSLCPTTEANLGDGIFPLRDYLHNAGSFGIGSDSQVSVSPMAELRLLEYGQRLSYQQRNIATSDNDPHCGDYLWNNAVTGGAMASGEVLCGLQAGSVANFVVLNSDYLPGHCFDPAQLLDALVFSGSNAWVHDVYVGGQCVVSGGHHAHEFEARQNYQRAVAHMGEAARFWKTSS